MLQAVAILPLQPWNSQANMKAISKLELMIICVAE
jgi:hypothetical protein